MNFLWCWNFTEKSLDTRSSPCLLFSYLWQVFVANASCSASNGTQALTGEVCSLLPVHIWPRNIYFIICIWVKWHQIYMTVLKLHKDTQLGILGLVDSRYCEVISWVIIFSADRFAWFNKHFTKVFCQEIDCAWCQGHSPPHNLSFFSLSFVSPFSFLRIFLLPS